MSRRLVYVDDVDGVWGYFSASMTFIATIRTNTMMSGTMPMFSARPKTRAKRPSAFAVSSFWINNASNVQMPINASELAMATVVTVITVAVVTVETITFPLFPKTSM